MDTAAWSLPYGSNFAWIMTSLVMTYTDVIICSVHSRFFARHLWGESWNSCEHFPLLYTLSEHPSVDVFLVTGALLPPPLAAKSSNSVVWSNLICY